MQGAGGGTISRRGGFPCAVPACPSPPTVSAERSRPSRPPVWAGVLLAGLLLLAQGLGLWHRVAHGPAGLTGSMGPGAAVASSAMPALAGTDEGPALDPSADGDAWFGHAAGAHGGVDCLWFDHLACGDGAPQASAPLLPAPLGAEADEPLPSTALLAARWAAFQARAPPGARQPA